MFRKIMQVASSIAQSRQVARVSHLLEVLRCAQRNPSHFYSLIH